MKHSFNLVQRTNAVSIPPNRGKSQVYTWQTDTQVLFADENYARELMQLLSVGTKKLNMDGSPQLDDQGKTILTYTNADIVEYARAWTGFSKFHIVLYSFIKVRISETQSFGPPSTSRSSWKY